MVALTAALARPAPSSVLATLERETVRHHEDAEADLFRILDEPTRENYVKFLSRTFHFEYGVEVRIARTDSLPIRFVGARLKTGRLGDDLLALGTSPYFGSMFATPIELPELADGYDALAWIYVLQRTTLHHQQLYRALIPRLRTTLQVASRYLTTHASDVHQRWHELGAYLDRVVTAEKLARVVAVACNAFALQHRWYSGR